MLGIIQALMCFCVHGTLSYSGEFSFLHIHVALKYGVVSIGTVLSTHFNLSHHLSTQIDA